MYGSIIGMVPKSFIITLIQHHMWYENNRTVFGGEIPLAYNTSRRRSTVPNKKVGIKVINSSSRLTSGELLEVEPE